MSYSFLQGLGNIAQENTTADISVEDQPWPPLDMVTVDLERELHKPNCWTRCKLFVVVNISCVLTTWNNFLQFFFELHWIEKPSGCGHLLEHLESSGTEVMMRGPVVHHLRGRGDYPTDLRN